MNLEIWLELSLESLKVGSWVRLRSWLAHRVKLSNNLISIQIWNPRYDLKPNF